MQPPAGALQRPPGEGLSGRGAPPPRPVAEGLEGGAGRGLRGGGPPLVLLPPWAPGERQEPPATRRLLLPRVTRRQLRRVHQGRLGLPAPAVTGGPGVQAGGGAPHGQGGGPGVAVGVQVAERQDGVQAAPRRAVVAVDGAVAVAGEGGRAAAAGVVQLVLQTVVGGVGHVTQPRLFWLVGSGRGSREGEGERLKQIRGVCRVQRQDL